MSKGARREPKSCNRRRTKVIGVRKIQRLVQLVAAPKRHLPMLRAGCPDIGDGISWKWSPKRHRWVPKSSRQCPFVSCKYHLFLDVDSDGSVIVNFPELQEPDGSIRFEDMPETCALDVADRGGLSLDEVARVMNLSPSRVNQIELGAYAIVEERLDVKGWMDDE